MKHIPPDFYEMALQLEPSLKNLPGIFILVDGRSGIGKTTFGRFLACYFNITLIEADEFIINGKDRAHDLDTIRRIIASRLAIPRPVILESFKALELTKALGLTPNILLHVTHTKYQGSESLQASAEAYEAIFKPAEIADFNFCTSV